jgi:hypothetical protein
VFAFGCFAAGNCVASVAVVVAKKNATDKLEKSEEKCEDEWGVVAKKNV